MKKQNDRGVRIPFLSSERNEAELAEVIGLLSAAASRFVPELEQELRRRKIATEARPLEAPLQGDPLSLGAGIGGSVRVHWMGLELDRASVVFVETPVYPWPQIQLQSPQRQLQTIPPSGDPNPPNRSAWKPAQEVSFESLDRTTLATIDRESRSLLLSALRTAALKARVTNPVQTHEGAASPGIFLSRLHGSGIPVHPWKVQKQPSSETGTPIGKPGSIAIDLQGRTLGQRPSRPGPGELALVFSRPPQEVESILVVGEEVPGRLQFDSAESWQDYRESSSASPSLPHKTPEREGANRDPKRERAVAACRWLGLDFAEITFLSGEDDGALLMVDGSPDFEGWLELSDGRVVESMAATLTRLAQEGSGLRREKREA